VRRKLAAITALAIALPAPPVIAQSSACAAYDGALIVSSDGTYLGTVSNSYNSDSIFNDIGTFGSDLSSKSIWNDIGTYGSDISSKSAMNDIASDPPMLIKNRQIIGFLTTNKIKPGAVNPILLGAVCYDYKPHR
jgi:hypothetical protein